MEKEYSVDRGCEGRGICGSPIKGRFWVLVCYSLSALQLLKRALVSDVFNLNENGFI